MSWTPIESSKVSVVAAETVDVKDYDLVVVVVNDTNITTHVDLKYQTIVQQALEQNNTKTVMHLLVDSSQLQRVAVLELKNMGASLGSLLKSEKAVESCIVLLPVNVTCLEDCATELIVQLYEDNRYKSNPDEKKCKNVDFVWPSPHDLPCLKRATYIADGVFLTKDIVNAPHNVLNSFSLAETAQRLARESGGLLKCKILEAKDCEKRGMGAYLGVARGSETVPKFIHLTYKPKGKKKGVRKVGIVGKGLLFDTGGYNIKTAGMELMKFDCGGAAAVLGAARAIAALQPPDVEAHFVIAACEVCVVHACVYRKRGAAY
jgi:leucyl aminopeptidase